MSSSSRADSELLHARAQGSGLEAEDLGRPALAAALRLEGPAQDEVVRREAEQVETAARGAGPRCLLSSENQLNIAIDYAVGKDSDAVFFFVGESF